MVRIKPTTPKKKKPSSKILYTAGGKSYYVNKKLIRSIRDLQRSTKLCIPKLPFSRLFHEILMAECAHINLRVQSRAIAALQESAEYYLVELFEDSCMLSAHAKRLTLRPDDISLALKLRGTKDICNK